MLETLFERWNGGDRAVREDEIDPEVELHTRLAAVAGKPYRGHAGVDAWARDIDEQFERWEVRAEEMIETGDGRVLVLGEVDLQGRGSDVAFKQPFAWVFAFRGGRMSRMEVFQSHADGRKAAGLL